MKILQSVNTVWYLGIRRLGDPKLEAHGNNGLHVRANVKANGAEDFRKLLNDDG